MPRWPGACTGETHGNHTPCRQSRPIGVRQLRPVITDRSRHIRRPGVPRDQPTWVMSCIQVGPTGAEAALLPPSQDEPQGIAQGIHAHVDLGAEPAAAPAQGLGRLAAFLGGAPAAPSGMGPDHGAVDDGKSTTDHPGPGPPRRRPICASRSCRRNADAAVPRYPGRSPSSGQTFSHCRRCSNSHAPGRSRHWARSKGHPEHGFDETGGYHSSSRPTSQVGASDRSGGSLSLQELAQITLVLNLTC